MDIPTVDLTPATGEVKRIVAGVRDGQLSEPTPDEGMKVADLLDHLTGVTLAFRRTAEKSPVEGAPSWPADPLPEDWRTRIPEQLDDLAPPRGRDRRRGKGCPRPRG